MTPTRFYARSNPDHIVDAVRLTAAADHALLAAWCGGDVEADGTPCAYGCGGRATTPYGTCQRCEDEATGRDDIEDEDD